MGKHRSHKSDYTIAVGGRPRSENETHGFSLRNPDKALRDFLEDEARETAHNQSEESNLYPFIS